MGNLGKPKKLLTMQKECSCDSVAIMANNFEALRFHSDIVIASVVCSHFFFDRNCSVAKLIKVL